MTKHESGSLQLYHLLPLHTQHHPNAPLLLLPEPCGKRSRLEAVDACKREKKPTQVNSSYNFNDLNDDEVVASGVQECNILQNPFNVHAPLSSHDEDDRREWVRCNREGYESKAYGGKQESHSVFKTAKQKLSLDIMNKKQQNSRSEHAGNCTGSMSYGKVLKSLGARRNVGSKFVPPVMNTTDDFDGMKSSPATAEALDCTDPRLVNVDPKMVQVISNEIIDHGPPVDWDDIAGLQFAKKTIKEIVVWPILRPDIFTGLRGPPKGLLLFGPPGTGKTLIGKCIASQSKSTFFSISASSLTSKWVGDGEKMVRALFAVARVHEPAVIFIDEIDSLLSQRSEHEHESSRRIKTEFLVQLDGATTEERDRLLVVGATNRPQEIDEAARRRFMKRLYIPLPDLSARRHIINHLLLKQSHCLNHQHVDLICARTEGYSGSDMANLCREAALGPIRRLDVSDIKIISLEQVQPISVEDFTEAVEQVKASVSSEDLHLYTDWNSKFGSWGR